MTTAPLQLLEGDAGEHRSVPIAKITVTGRNDRKTFDEDRLRELADSIAEDGLLQPVLLRKIDGRLELVLGERRLRAHKMLGLTRIDAIVKSMTDEQASRRMLAENLNREDLNPIEEAQGYGERMRAFDLTAAQVAEWGNVTTARVATRLPLLRLCPSAADAVAKRAMPVNIGVLLSKLDHNRQRMALGAYVREGLKYFEVQRLAARLFEDQQAEGQAVIDTSLCIQTITRQAQAEARRLTRKQLVALIDELANHAGSLPAHLAARVAAARK